MNYFKISNKELLNSFEELSKEFGFAIDENGVDICFEKSNYLGYVSTTNSVVIKYEKTSDIFFVFSQFLSKKKLKNEEKKFVRKNNLSYMADCSRNAVMKVETAKKLIRHLAVFGYDEFMLYCEDTIKVESYPYLGYLRNGYSKENIKEIDDYCKMFGIELIPCIQTLAHFNAITRYPTMEHLFDCNDILLVGQEKTYQFIEAIIKTCSEYFSSKKINIGMDEAYMLGRGHYLDQNGFKTRFEIMNQHVSNVLSICEKYHLKAAMWSDMYFGLALSGGYSGKLPEEIAKKIPQNVELIYWNYYQTEVEDYSKYIKVHKKLRNQIGFAGGAWKWAGFTPDNAFSLAAIKASMIACHQNKIYDYYVTGWGDNGAEASQFSTLPSLFYAGRCKYGLMNLTSRSKNLFKALTEVKFDVFMNLDLANRIRKDYDLKDRNTANKYLLFNDVLLGTMDTIITEDQKKLYADHTKKLGKIIKNVSRWKYLFKTQYDLCKILSLKATIGIELRRNYKNKNINLLKNNLKDLKTIRKLVNVFYEDFKTQWDTENRANGFDVEDIRIGALKQRLEVAIKKVENYIDKKTSSVPELEEELLCFNGHGKEFEKDFDNCEYRWRRITSVNVNE